MSDETVVTPVTTDTPIPVEVTVWYKNITLWTNVVTVGALVLTQYFGVVIDPKLQAGVLAIINIALRVPTMAVTKSRAMAHNRSIRSRMIK
jgi:hypothetical protein